MDYPRDNAFTFLFSTYKRTAGIAFAAILIIAIPVTLGLLNQQQDVRQRAQVAEGTTACSTDNDCQPGFACMGTPGDENSQTFCQSIDPTGEGSGSCPEDARMCEDGTIVVRQGPSCQFAACPGQTSCPEDARICEDGSTVVRTGPSCQFAECPAPRSCSTDEDCQSNEYKCKVVGIAESFPPRDIKQCIRDTGTKDPSPAVFDMNDDGKLNGIDFNILYSNFSSRQGD